MYNYILTDYRGFSEQPYHIRLNTFSSGEHTLQGVLHFVLLYCIHNVLLCTLILCSILQYNIKYPH